LGEAGSPSTNTELRIPAISSRLDLCEPSCTSLTQASPQCLLFQLTSHGTEEPPAELSQNHRREANGGCFKILSCGVVCHPAIDN
jgi:hypothetical protein